MARSGKTTSDLPMSLVDNKRDEPIIIEYGSKTEVENLVVDEHASQNPLVGERVAKPNIGKEKAVT